MLRTLRLSHASRGIFLSTPLIWLTAANVSATTIPIFVDTGTDSGLEILNATANYNPAQTSDSGRTQGGTSISFDLTETEGIPLEALELRISLTDARSQLHRTLLWEKGLPALASQRLTLPVIADVQQRIYSVRLRITAVRRAGSLRPVFPFQGQDVPLNLPTSSSVSIRGAVARVTEDILFVKGQHSLTSGIDAAQLRLIVKGDEDDRDGVEETIRLSPDESGFFVKLEPPEGMTGIELRLERIRQEDGKVTLPESRSLTVELGTLPVGFSFSAVPTARFDTDGSILMSFDVSTSTDVRAFEVHVLALDPFRREGSTYTTETSKIFFGSSGQLHLVNLPEGVETLRVSVTAIKSSDGSITLIPIG